MRGRPRLEVPVAEAVRRYENGERTYTLARVYGVGQRTMIRRLHGAGVKMRLHGGEYGWRKRGGPLHLRGNGYLCTHDREGRQCSIHRAYWETRNGLIPNSHVVHHINGDKSDNRIKNLACMTNIDHAALHSRRRESPAWTGPNLASLTA